MRIALDAMGGDYAPGEIIAGAVAFARKGTTGVQLTLIGDAEQIEACLREQNAASLPIQVMHASQSITMDESPAVALRKKRDSSIGVAMRMAASGEVDAVISAGNTGAVVAAAKVECGLLPGIERPAIAALIPGPFGATVLIDAGATVNCKAQHLLQFAQMGACYAQFLLRRTHPVVGLLSVGEEDAKGNAITRDAFGLLRESPLQFYGNVEGQDVFLGKVDVIVCDGFVGNVSLKVMEGMASGIRMMIERYTSQQPWWRSLQRFLLKPFIGRINRQFDSARFGGAPLLGVNCTCVCAHGNSRSRSIVSALERTRENVAQQLNTRIMEALARS